MILFTVLEDIFFKMFHGKDPNPTPVFGGPHYMSDTTYLMSQIVYVLPELACLINPTKVSTRSRKIYKKMDEGKMYRKRMKGSA